MHKLLLLIVACSIFNGCGTHRPAWVRTYPDYEAEASPKRFYDVTHLFAHRYFIEDPDFDLSEALKGRSSGPSTQLDWSYQGVWHDQGVQIQRILEAALHKKGMAADEIEYTFQAFIITATPPVHREIERVFLDLAAKPSFDPQ